MRRTLGVQCGERQLWCELLPFVALLEQPGGQSAARTAQLAPLAYYSSGAERRSGSSKQAVSVELRAIAPLVLRRPLARHAAAVAESAAMLEEEDDIED